MDEFEKFYTSRYEFYLPHYVEEESHFKDQLEQAFNAGFKHGMDYGRVEWTDRKYEV